MQDTSETLLIWNLEKVVNKIEGRCTCVCPVSIMSVVSSAGESYIRSIEPSGSAIWETAFNDCNHKPGRNVYIPIRTFLILHQTLSHRTLCRTHTYICFIVKTLWSESPRANYTDRATAACRRSDCQLLQIEGATRSA
jgi:hypothetical protein